MPDTRTPVLFIHGLWLHATSWAAWIELFREAGYDAGGPGLARRPRHRRGGPPSARTRSPTTASTTSSRTTPTIIDAAAGQADPDRALLRRHDRPEAARARTSAPAAIAIDAAQIKGVLPLPLSALRGDPAGVQEPGQQAPGRLADRRAVPLRLRQRHPGGGVGRAVRALGDPRARASRCSRRPPPTSTRTRRPRSTPATPDRGPLLLIMGGKDHTVPEAVTRATLKQYRHIDGGHRHLRVPRPRPLADHRPRLARGRRRVPDLARGAGPLTMDLDLSGTAGGGHRRQQGHRPGRHPGPGREGARSWPAPGGSRRARRAGRRRPMCARVAVDLTTPTARPAWSTRPPPSFGGLDILVNNVGAVRPRLDGLPGRHRRGLGLGADDQFLWPPSAPPGPRSRPCWPAGPGQHRDHQLGQRLPARSRRHRLQRRQGRADQLLQVAVEGGRPAASGSTPSARDRCDTDLWLGEGGVAATVAGATGADPDDVVRRRGRGRPATGRFTRPDEVADLVRLPGQRPGRQHHRQRLRHRRRPGHHPLTSGRAYGRLLIARS